MTTGAGRWLDQVEALAREVLPDAVFRYVNEGAREEITLREAVSAWESIRVAPRVLRDVRRIDTTTELLGTRFQLPLGVAPMTLQRAAHPEGEVAMARAASAAGVPLVVSSNAGSTFTQVQDTGVVWWLQAYLTADRDQTLRLLEAATQAGAAAVVLTVDTPVVGTRYPVAGSPRVWEVADPSWVGANTPGGAPLDPGERAKAMDLGPADLTWLREVTGLPVVVKGVLRADDAQLCADSGADAVWVSNHGGRQLDQTVATAHCVAAVRAAVGEGVQVYVDGGVRSGLHAMLALSLGADAAFVGRPMLHALAAGGQEGAARALAELGSELEESLRLAGCADAAQTRGIVCPAGGEDPRGASDLREPGV